MTSTDPPDGLYRGYVRLTLYKGFFAQSDEKVYSRS